jgi:GNAT superfamily N-acetyltransferase
MPATTPYALRPAEPRDVPALVGLIRELAEFERLGHLVQVTEAKLAPQLFGARPAAEAMVAEVVATAGEEASDRSRTVIGFALYFTNFSTFLAQPGLYLEDLYVRPEHRGSGIGRALLQRLAALAVQRGCGRFEWSVLDWNTGAIGFYESLGAKLLPEWRICRVTSDALTALAG